MTPCKILYFSFLFMIISCSSGDETNRTTLQSDINKKDTVKLIDESALPDKELEETWEIFANAVLSGDLIKFKQLSSNCVQCANCLTNTPKEDSLFNDFQNKNPNTWYEKKYSVLAYIPIDKFLKEDFPIIFDTFTKTRLLDSSEIQFYNSKHNLGMFNGNCIISSKELKSAKLFEIFVKVVDSSSETEGMSKAFAFIETKQGYRFCGYSTIP